MGEIGLFEAMYSLRAMEVGSAATFVRRSFTRVGRRGVE
jgi:hypothetical protein